MTKSARRLTKAERRKQLLETAFDIVQKEGTDALTLGYLAECAGVSKPIAYEHFGTRAGLLIVMYRQLDHAKEVAFLAALDKAPRHLESIAQVVGQAYMECYTDVGPEWHALSAALKGAEEMEAVQQELLDHYVDLYQEALRPYCNLDEGTLRMRCIGIIGAGEAISKEMIRGHTDMATAASCLASLIVCWLK
ncbi:TetR/AcrR family transcriptional regulator [Billgrantia kenyensis]|uniref:TetR/AcrR family transcriptional regulator n=1 Tax=Billgrantia kenyensis TaxID=321266 RepID=A0A7V9W4A0_9GAMM|nr:TetR/AcrR family transcriptional regulator [Halomonas kenyensis]MBA2780795.1 TetR/AcrR family transcriptional regulator [Halomonas kenyensis]MCG6663620.1 TetR/AcrR family transcriptional regulator [Halomonas kenyensis]